MRHELGRISQEHEILNWPSRDDIQSVVHRADGLFIYAVTFCGFVDDKYWNPQERLSEILRGGYVEAGGTRTVQLDEMYNEVLRCALTKGRREGEVLKLCDRFRQVVGSIVTLSDTLSVFTLANLLNISARNVELTLGTLHSVLIIPNNPEISVWLLHLSFHDFLSDEARCRDRRFLIEKSIGTWQTLHQLLKGNDREIETKYVQSTNPGLFSTRHTERSIRPPVTAVCPVCLSILVGAPGGC